MMPPAVHTRQPAGGGDADASAIAIQLVRLIQCYRLDLSTEKRLQADLADALERANITFEREKHLSDRDIPDFLVAGGVVIECKMHCARKIAIYRQLCRYAEHPAVRAIIMASNVSMGLPSSINGKPVFVASLSRGWL